MTLVDALIHVESNGNDHAIGDKTLQYSAYGPLQIRWPCVSDVNDFYGTNYKAKMCLGNRALSIEIFNKYTALYATKERLGREPTDEDIARLWNGGIGGMVWRPHPIARVEKQLQDYWGKVKLLL